MDGDDGVSTLEDDLVTSIDLLFLFVSLVLVLMMQVGFAMYEVGTIRRTPMVVILLKNVGDASIAFSCWLALGYTLSADGNKFLGTHSRPFLTGDEFDKKEESSLAFMKFLFSAAFSATAVTVVSGVLDFAGSGVVHGFAGAASLTWAYLLGAREGRFTKDQNGKVTQINDDNGFKLKDRAQQAHGVFILWLGWYGFNCGSVKTISTPSARQLMAIAAVNTSIAPVVCCLTSVAIEWAYHENIFGAAIQNPRDTAMRDLHSAAINGILAGLVSITAGAATTDPRATIAVAIIAAFVYHITNRLQLNYGIDDPVSAAPVHFWCGVWGMLAASLMLDSDLYYTWMVFTGVDDPTQCKRRGQFIANLSFTLAFTVWSCGTSVILFRVFRWAFPRAEECNDDPEDPQQINTLINTINQVLSDQLERPRYPPEEIQ